MRLSPLFDDTLYEFQYLIALNWKCSSKNFINIKSRFFGDMFYEWLILYNYVTLPAFYVYRGDRGLMLWKSIRWCWFFFFLFCRFALNAQSLSDRLVILFCSLFLLAARIENQVSMKPALYIVKEFVEWKFFKPFPFNSHHPLHNMTLFVSLIVAE